MLDEHYLDLLDSAAELVTELETYQDEALADRVVTLLQHVDLVHREGLSRLIEALRAKGAGSAVDRIVEEDSVVRILLGLYGLADLELPSDQMSPNAEGGEAPVPGQGFFPIERLAVRRSDARRDDRPR